MKTINLEDLLAIEFEPISEDCTTPTQDLQLAIALNPDLNRIKAAMLEFGKQLLQLAAENAEGDIVDDSDYSNGKVVIDKDSILDTLNQVE